MSQLFIFDFLGLSLTSSSFSDQLNVSQTILDLNALSPHTVRRSKQDTILKELEARGLLVLGKHNLEVEKILRTNYAFLIASSRVKKKDLEMDLFARQVLTHFFFHSFTTIVVEDKTHIVSRVLATFLTEI